MIDWIPFEEFNNNRNINKLVDKYKSINYSQLFELVSSFEKFIEERNINIILGSNTINAIAYYLACLNKQAVPLFLSQNIKKYQLQNYINRFSPFSIYSEILLEVDEASHISYEYSNLYIFKSNKKLTSKYPYLLLTTSGSTGNPKVVIISKKNLISNTESITQYLKINKKDKHITTLPLNYTYGLSCINTHLSKGASIVLTNESILNKDFWEILKIHEPNTFSGVPYTYEMICRLGLKSLPLGCVEKFTQAGGKLANKYLKIIGNYLDFKKDFYIMYGQTEATARMSYLPPKYFMSKRGSIGIPIPNGSFILNFDKKYPDYEGHSVGELIYKGPNVTSGYAESFNDLEKNFIHKETLETGDLAYQDCDGFYFICGRINRFAKISGLRISLDDIQNIINEKYKCAVTSNDLFIYIYLESNDCEDPFEYVVKNLKEMILKKVNINPIILKFKFIDKIPVNDSNKIVYGDLN